MAINYYYYCFDESTLIRRGFSLQTDLIQNTIGTRHLFQLIMEHIKRIWINKSNDKLVIIQLLDWGLTVHIITIYSSNSFFHPFF